MSDASLTRPRVLLVEDEVALRTVLARVLERAGYETTQVTTGWEGLRLVDVAEQPYDLVVTNSTLPTMDGTTFIHYLRQRIPEQRVLQISGAPRSPESAAAFPDVPFLEKPFEVPDFLTCVDELVRGHRD